MKLVYLKWEDHATVFQNKWRFLDEIPETEALVCETVGWIVREDKKYFTIAGNLGSAGGGSHQASSLIHVLKSAVIKRRNLKVPA